MRLDVALMRLLGLEGAFDDKIGLAETGLDIAVTVLSALGDVGRLAGLGLDALREYAVVQDGRSILHRFIDVGHMRQHLVVHLDQLQRLLGRAGIDRGDRSHRMAIVERLFARHAVVQNVIHGGIAIGEIGQVGRSDHRLHTGELLRLRRVDLSDRGVGVRAPENASDQLAGHVEVRAVARTAGHFVDAVGTYGTGADRGEIAFQVARIKTHGHAALITFAAS